MATIGQSIIKKVGTPSGVMGAIANKMVPKPAPETNEWAQYDPNKYAGEATYYEQAHPDWILDTVVGPDGHSYYRIKPGGVDSGHYKWVRKAQPEERAQQSWMQYYQPQAQQSADALAREMQLAYNRMYAEGRGALGYAAGTSGYGDSGMWQAAKNQMYATATAQQLQILAKKDSMMDQFYREFMLTKDAQSFQLKKMELEQQYRKEIAEMNQPSWWQGLGQLVGTGLAMFGLGGGSNTGVPPVGYGTGGMAGSYGSEYQATA